MGLPSDFHIKNLLSGKSVRASAHHEAEEARIAAFRAMEDSRIAAFRASEDRRDAAIRAFVDNHDGTILTDGANAGALMLGMSKRGYGIELTANEENGPSAVVTLISRVKIRQLRDFCNEALECFSPSEKQ